MDLKKILLLFVGILLAGVGQSKDLGVWGTTYPVIEEDLMAVMMRKGWS